MATLADLRAQVRSLTDMRQTTLVPDEDVTAFLNEAYREFLGSREWPFLESIRTLSVPAGSHTAALAVGDADRVLEVTWTDGKVSVPLSPLTAQQAAAADITGTGRTGTPHWYRAPQLGRAGALELFPTPTAAGTVLVTVSAQPADLAADTDTPVFAAEFHAVLAYGAACLLLSREGDDSGRTSTFAGQAGAITKRAAKRYMPAADRSPLVIGGRRDAGRRFRADGWRVAP